MPATLLLLLTLLTANSVPLPTQGIGGASECRLRIAAGGVPLVRVRVTSQRDAWFVLDTGASGTTIHVELAQRLGLSPSGAARLHTVEGTAQVTTVRLERLTIVGWSVAHDVHAAVHDLALVRHTVPDAEGIVGQDVLAPYDYLIDPQRGRLTIGRFSAPRAGVRVPLAWSAGRPMLLMDRGQDRYGLVLDTGADALVMEAGAARQAIGDVSPLSRTRGVLQTHLGARSVEVEHHVGVRMANVDLPPLALVRVPADAWSMSPEVGLLPASVFSRVYVSARTGEAFVWPK
jgi:predicted aspartyl protease